MSYNNKRKPQRNRAKQGSNWFNHGPHNYGFPPNPMLPFPPYADNNFPPHSGTNFFVDNLTQASNTKPNLSPTSASTSYSNFVPSSEATADQSTDNEDQERLSNSEQKIGRRPNFGNKKMGADLLKGLAQPVESSKAERMMQKMGWQGGALGQRGDGLTEPIALNFNNLKSTAGLGHNPDIEKKTVTNEKQTQSTINEHTKMQNNTTIIYTLKPKNQKKASIPKNIGNNEDQERLSNSEQKIGRRPNLGNKKMGADLLKGLAQPVESSKAERMMQKMGWQGGALGQRGDGLTEPIALNFNNLKSTAGLGHNPDIEKKTVTNENATQSAINELTKMQNNTTIIYILKPVPGLGNRAKNQKIASIPKNIGNKPKINIRKKTIPKKKLKQMGKFYDPMKTEALNDILDFVMDVKQYKMVFDKMHIRRQRLIIHRLVEAIRNGEDLEYNDDEIDVQMAIVDEIYEFNNYVLVTESHGEGTNRYLHLYKEAPEHVYLVTKEDLFETPREGEVCTKMRGRTKNSNEDLNPSNPLSESDDSVDNINNTDNLKTDLANSESFIKNVDAEETTLPVPINDTKSVINGITRDKNTKMESNTNTCEHLAQSNKDITNPETNNKPTDKKVYIEDTLLYYLQEFIESVDYTEMRFLGDFDDLEQKILDNLLLSIEHFSESNENSDKFINDIRNIMSNHTKYVLTVDTDCNGGHVILKDIDRNEDENDEVIEVT